eukprot:3045974-Pyramimonas_sp.AAC.1
MDYFNEFTSSVLLARNHFLAAATLRGVALAHVARHAGTGAANAMEAPAPRAITPRTGVAYLMLEPQMPSSGSS